MKKEISITEVMATRMRNDLIDQQKQIEKLRGGFPEPEKSKLNKLIDSLERMKGDLWRNCISNPMV